MLAAFTPSHLPIYFAVSQTHSHVIHKPQFCQSLFPPRPTFRLRAASGSDSDREEVRWIREEQRWLREEQRWLREEQRWQCERASLLREISELKIRIEAMGRESPSGAAEAIASLASILQVLKDAGGVGRLADGGAGPSPIVLEAVERESVAKEEEVFVKEIRVLETDAVEVKKVRRKVLKKGAEGEEVRALQEALENLGFYSGEEDIEFSSFSSGTERAVKTWQSSVGAPEDGIMTSELLEWLYNKQSGDPPDLSKQESRQLGTTTPIEKPENGVAVASVTKISEVQKKVITEKGIAEVDFSEHRVFLLGENRWEEPSRLIGRDNESKGSKKPHIASKCIVCRGEGRVLCMECDGTGEPNIEQQFLEWVDEEMKCPYCEGRGFTVCDACQK
uniref:Peptidoglycan binding-like domain-containing protein n=1 Tax=Kalanchoe fedtschenkoi TaxID=63787 RepID=A0A7N0UQV8_KALFE